MLIISAFFPRFCNCGQRVHGLPLSESGGAAGGGAAGGAVRQSSAEQQTQRPARWELDLTDSERLKGFSLLSKFAGKSCC